MKNPSTISHAASATFAALLLAGCSAGASSAFGPTAAASGVATTSGFGLPPRNVRSAHVRVRPDRCAGNKLYFSDYKNSVIDSFGSSGGSVACTVTPGGLSNPVGIWLQPVAGTYHNDLFVANAGNGTAVAYKTPLTNSSVPLWQFKVGSVASDVVQDQSGNVYVAVYGTPTIDVFTPPFSSCSYPGECSPSYTIKDPCGSVYWLATDGKGDVYSNNYCGYVTLFITPIVSGEVGAPLSGISYAQPGGMIVDKKFELVVNDPGTQKISAYGLDPEEYIASYRFDLSPYSGAIGGIGLDSGNEFLWGANSATTRGEQYLFTSGGTAAATATDPTLVMPMGAAVRPSSAE